jgi:hypothetical protein
LIYQVVAATLTAVAIPFAARVLEPVDVPPANLNVSDVIAIVTVVALGPAINVIVVPIGYATDAAAGMVIVCAVVVI